MRSPSAAIAVLLGRLLVGFKRLLRPLVKTPQNDLWERQRTFNLILIEHLARLEAARADHLRRIEYQEALDSEGIHEVMRHNDALFARADQKLDRYRREARDLLGSLGAALATVRSAPPRKRTRLSRRSPAPTRSTAIWSWSGAIAAPRRRSASGSPPICPICRTARTGARPRLRPRRGAGPAARSRHRRPRRGLERRAWCSSAATAGWKPRRGTSSRCSPAWRRGASAASISFHVIEHLPAAGPRPPGAPRLAGAAAGRRADPGDAEPALRGGGGAQLLARPHARPAGPPREPEADVRARRLRARRAARPAPLPATASACPRSTSPRLPPEQRPLADRVNRLRDRLDELLFGYQDFGMVGRKNPHP